MKEVVNNEIMETVVEGMEVCDMEPEGSGKGLIGALVVGAVAVAGGLVALAYKNRDKIEERRIRKLEKRGYVVFKADEVDVVEKDFEENEETE